MRGIVLGAGLAGLITGYLLGWPVIGEEVGGQGSNPFPLGPRILEADEYSYLLLKLLGIEYKPREFRVGYIYKGSKEKFPSVHRTPPQDFRERYYKKTRGEDSVITKSSMSGGKPGLFGWDLYEIALLNHLAAKVPVIKRTVTAIDIQECSYGVEPYSIVLGKRKEPKGVSYNAPIPGLIYDRTIRVQSLVNTLPLPTFLTLTRLSWALERPKSGDVYFVKLTLLGESRTELGFEMPSRDYAYAYIADENIPIHRISRYGELDHSYIVEVNDSRYHDLIDLVQPNQKVLMIGSHLLKGSQMLNPYSESPDYIGNIKMIGRYANWNHSIKLNHVIKEALDLAKSMGRVFE